MSETVHQLEVKRWAVGTQEFECPHVDHDGRMRTCKRRDCERCGPRWARDWRKSMAENLGALHGPVVLISITAPGSERMPWDEHHCSHRRKHKHRGPDGCRIQQRAAREWADTCVWRWQKLREAARLATVRATQHFADGGLNVVVLERVWEPQKRGVPHLHIVLPYRTHHEQMAAHCFANELAIRATDYDFGFVDAKSDMSKPFGRKLKIVGAEEASRYLSSYLTGRSKKKNSIRSNLADPIMPRSLIWLTPKLTSNGQATASGRPTYVTMRTLRRARQMYAWAKGLCPAPIWQDVYEAAKIAYVCLKVFGRGDSDDDADVDIDELFGLAAGIEKRLGGWRWKNRYYSDPEPFTHERRVTTIGRQIDEFWAGVAGLQIAPAAEVAA